MVERGGGMAVGPVCTGYAISCGLGMTTAEVLQGLRAGRSGLRRPQLQLPFDALCGELPEALPAADDAGGAWTAARAVAMDAAKAVAMDAARDAAMDAAMAKQNRRLTSMAASVRRLST